MDQDRLIGIGKASALVGVHPDTLRQWEKNGQIKSVRTKGNHRRYRASDLTQVQNDNTKWDRFRELFHKYPAYHLLSNEKALNEWLYFYEDHDPEIAHALRCSKKSSDEILAIKYVLVSVIRAKMAKENNQMIDEQNCSD